MNEEPCECGYSEIRVIEWAKSPNLMVIGLGGKARCFACGKEYQFKLIKREDK